MSGTITELKGKVILIGELKAITGLRIGTTSSGLEIGGVDNLVIRDPVNGRPYIPGSSLKGKMRGLLSRALGLQLKTLIRGDGSRPEIRIHWCEEDEYLSRSNGKPCVLCRTFGVAGEHAQEPTRLIVRDAPLLDKLEVEDGQGNTIHRSWREIETDLPYSEVKWEAVIDVLTSAATPRQMERVPAGALFEVELLFSVYDYHDRECLRTLIMGMSLLEDDYLGSSGTRGYGKVAFRNLDVYWKPIEVYKKPPSQLKPINGEAKTPKELLKMFDEWTKHIWTDKG